MLQNFCLVLYFDGFLISLTDSSVARPTGALRLSAVDRMSAVDTQMDCDGGSGHSANEAMSPEAVIEFKQ